MFDTTMIGNRIKQARIDKNMTQMNLADAMGVSYQAVSNWERGNSMPDISKLGDLCGALGLTVNELLGLEESVPNAVTKAVNREELTVEELAEVAPMLPPKEVKERMEAIHIPMPDMSFMKDISVSVGRLFGVEMKSDGEESAKETFREKMKRMDEETRNSKRKKPDLSRIADMAPYLDQAYLDELIRQADLSDLDGLDEIAPFLSRATLGYLVEQADLDELDEVVDIAPFLDDATLEKLVRRCEDADEFDAIAELAPFLSERTLDKLVDRYLERNGEADLEDLYPFMGKETLRKLARLRMEQQDSDALEDMMPFL